MTISGLKVLDLGWVWAGPLVGSAFADLGADVVKVESSARLDAYRLRGVEKAEQYGDQRREASPSFHKLNRGKRSITIDLRNPAGRELVLSLAEAADLLIENFSAGTLGRLGLGWPVLKERNPRLVAVSMSAGGQRGVWKDLKAYALVTTALAGYESLVGYRDESPVGGATFGIADPNVSAFGVLAAVSALWKAQRTGCGSYVDLSGVESVVAVMGAAFIAKSRLEHPELELIVPCAGDDRWALVVLTDAAQVRTLQALVESDGRTPSPSSGEAGEPGLEQTVSDWSRSLEQDALVRLLTDSGLVAAPVLTIEKRNDDPFIRDQLIEITHPVTGPERVLPSAWGTEVPLAPAPLLGQHTDEVLTEWLDLDESAVAELRATGALI